MKTLYTKEELAELSPEDLEELMYLTTNSGHIPYSDIVAFEDLKVILRSGEALNAENESILQKVRNDKARYDLNMSALKATEEDAASKQKFRDELETAVLKQVTMLDNSYQQATASLATMMTKMTTELSTSIALMQDDMKGIHGMHDRAISKFNTFNTEAYDIRMTKVDKIIDSFKELLAD